MEYNLYKVHDQAWCRSHYVSIVHYGFGLH